MPQLNEAMSLLFPSRRGHFSLEEIAASHEEKRVKADGGCERAHIKSAHCHTLTDLYTQNPLDAETGDSVFCILFMMAFNKPVFFHSLLSPRLF